MSVAPVAKILIKIRSAGATKMTTVYGEHGFQVHTVRIEDGGLILRQLESKRNCAEAE